MIGKELIDEKPVHLNRVKEVLSQEKKDGALTYEQKIVYDYSREFGKGTASKITKAVEELKASGMPDNLVVKIIDIKPKTKEEIALIFEKSRVDLNEERTNKIIELVKAL